MFRFWSSDSRGSEKTVGVCQPLPGAFAKQPPHPTLDGATSRATGISSPRATAKRKQCSSDDPSHATVEIEDVPAKRARREEGDGAVMHSCERAAMASPIFPSDSLETAAERAHDVIQYQFGYEILLKHNELRLINQELAKCQVALEQLRRCHLIPYPVNCPTPDQMLAISSGKGPAVSARRGEPLPRWAPPFGVVDGPYARHYAKWLIPDPKFDGMQPEWQPMPEMTRSRTSLEGRTTRNSVVDLGGFGAKRAVRGLSGQKLHALSSGYPAPKEKAGPCILKRADGQTVKLVCIDCHRDNFSSTQGFINHCRIAHRRDFKSHEEAAVACGHIIEVDEGGAAVAGEDKDKSGSSAPQASGLVHPFARADMTDQQAYRSLHMRIQESLRLYRQGKLPGVTSIPTSAPPAVPDSKPAVGFTPSSDTPYLSNLLRKRKFDGDLGSLVAEAKKQEVFEDVWSPGEESEDAEQASDNASLAPNASVGARAPVVMRVPARTAMSPAGLAAAPRPASSKGRSPHLNFASLPPMSMLNGKDDERPGVVMVREDEDVDMDVVDLSPNTLVSNNAPSLVSDDGEYDDSDDGSSESEAEGSDDDGLDTESISDVAEINIDEEHEPPRPLRHHHRGTSGVGSGTAVRLRKDDTKHVTFVSPVKNSAAKERRARKV